MRDRYRQLIKNSTSMTKEEIINHMAGVAAAVFRAEDTIRPQWEERLHQTHDADPETKEKTADAYLRAVADEMLCTYSDDELQRLYGDELNDIEPYDDF